MAPSDRSGHRRPRRPRREGRPRRARWALALAFVGGVPALVACNAIIGLGDFTKGECPGARCEDGGDVPDQVAEAAPDVIPDVKIDVKGADPVSWAAWKMPNYDGGTTFLPNQPLYTVVDANVVKDEVTGLVWRRATLAADATLDGAKAACTGLDPASGPWRMPKRIELVTLLDFGRGPTDLKINAVFTGVQNVRVWSSSEVRPFKGTADQEYWTVNFETGAVDTLRGDRVAKVLCVRAK